MRGYPQRRRIIHNLWRCIIHRDIEFISCNHDLVYSIRHNKSGFVSTVPGHGCILIYRIEAAAISPHQCAGIVVYLHFEVYRPLNHEIHTDRILFPITVGGNKGWLSINIGNALNIAIHHACNG